MRCASVAGRKGFGSGANVPGAGFESCSVLSLPRPRRRRRGRSRDPVAGGREVVHGDGFEFGDLGEFERGHRRMNDRSVERTDSGEYTGRVGN